MRNQAGWIRCGLLGVVGWLLLAAVRPRPVAALDAIDGLLALHVLCLTPLLLALRPPPRSLRWAWGVAAGLATFSSQLPLSPERGWWAVPWLAFSAWLLAGAVGDLLRSARSRGLWRCEHLGLRAAAHLFLFVGAGWLVFARTGVPLPGLDAEKVLLAAIHGHYTGFGGLILMAEAARRSTAGERRVLAATGIGLGLGFGLVGVGIAFAHALEPVGAGVLALALGGFAAVRVPQLLRSRGLEAVLGGLSLAGLAFGLSLGVMHSAGHEALSRPDMIRQHGWALALGFVLCGAASHLARHWATGPGPLLIYDGNCGLCDHTVQWILAHDRLKRIRFAALQGATAAPILRAHDLMPADGADFDTLVLAGPGEGVRVRSQAAFAILVHMGGVWRPLGHLGALVPRVLADAGYRLVANNRHRLFPRPDACRIPKPGERARFLP